MLYPSKYIYTSHISGWTEEWKPINFEWRMSGGGIENLEMG